MRAVPAVMAAVALHAAVLLMPPLRTAAHTQPRGSALLARVISSPLVTTTQEGGMVLHSQSHRPIASPKKLTAGEPGVAPKVKARVETKATETAASMEPTAPLAPEQPLPPAFDYLPATKLDQGPTPLHDIEPVYPIEAELQDGRVILRLLIDEMGSVDQAEVVRATPSGLFENAAIEAFGSAKFSPGMLLGVPVKSQVTIEVRFAPINKGEAVSGRSY